MHARMHARPLQGKSSPRVLQDLRLSFARSRLLSQRRRRPDFVRDFLTFMGQIAAYERIRARRQSA